MTLGCQHSLSVNGGVARREVAKNSKLQLGVRSGVANVSHEWSHERESRMGVASGVANVSCECESQVESRNVSREMGSRK